MTEQKLNETDFVLFINMLISSEEKLEAFIEKTKDLGEETQTLIEKFELSENMINQLYHNNLILIRAKNGQFNHFLI